MLTGREAAALLPPTTMTANDTLSSAIERGVELTRFDQQFSYRPRTLLPLATLFQVRWRTDRRTPEQEADRTRQDGRWYAGVERTLWKSYGIFTAAEGEHFEERAVGSAARGAANSLTRILRGGAGVHSTLGKYADAAASIGAVEDRRLEHVNRGLGTWARAALNNWNSGGYVQNANLAVDRETPGNLSNLDLSGHYDVFREFYPGNSNRTNLDASLKGRDFNLAQSDLLTRREDRKLAITDVLNYRVSNAADMELSGDISHDVTDVSQVNAASSRLEENQAGLQAQGVTNYRRWSLESKIGLRLVTQNIEDDILRGSRADWTLGAKGALHRKSSGSIALGVSKYQLDTRSEQNHDDRDELRFSGEAEVDREINRSVYGSLYLHAHIDHLVYIYSQYSANNRWTRYLTLRANIAHRPTNNFVHFLRAEISANYIDYDFEQSPRLSKSNIFRQLVLRDSVEWSLSRMIYSRLRGQGSLDEFGRLFWNSFEEELSDKTHALGVTAEIGFHVGWQMSLGAGGLWDSRKSVRYPSAADAASEVSQDYQAYGPVWFAERTANSGLVLRVRGRHLRQFRLDKADRWLFTGEGVVSWVW